MRLDSFLSVIILLLPIVKSDVKSLYKISLTQLQQLIQNKDLQKLRNVLKYEGAFAVDNLPDSYSTAIRDLKSSAPECLDSYRYPEFVLPDGSIRTTFATETSELPDCLSEAGTSIRSAFDQVYSSVSELVHAVAGPESLRWRNKSGSEPKQFSELPRKEHIHVYHSSKEEPTHKGHFATPFHVDNGVLLLITPVQEHPLQIKSAGGQILDSSEVGDDAVLVLIARGLPDWLLRGTREAGEFRPAPHGVPSLIEGLDTRTVFARMTVAPLSAVPASSDVKKTTFRQVFYGEQEEEDSNPGALCPLDPSLETIDRVPRSHGSHDGHDGHPGVHTEHKSFEDLQMEECLGNTAYCWMRCLEITKTCGAQDHYMCTNSANQTCCTDPEQEGTGNCVDMDDTCAWKCKDDPPPPADRFCQGSGTDMFMQGFQVSGNANKNCVILFFKAWLLDTRFKFAVACIGVIFLGIAVEGLLCLRRLLQSRKILRFISSPIRRASIISLFGLNIASGYLAMLVAMTYSVELFICMVVGLVIGHAIFNTSAPVGESVDPCCASQVIGESRETDANSDSSNMPKKTAPSSCHEEKTFVNQCYCSEGALTT